MKRIILSVFAFGVLALLTANYSSAQSMNAIQNQARAHAMQCAQPYLAPLATVEPVLVSTPRCLDGGTVYVHDVYVVYHCPPPHEILCLVIAPVLVATVTTDCNGHVASVICH